jgi:hypothetical protein
METNTKDNKLVTMDDINKEDEIETLWSNNDKLDILEKQMNDLENVRFDSYDHQVITYALSEFLDKIKWNNYSEFSENTNEILKGHKVPFSIRTKDKNTGKMDFWLTRLFINIKTNPHITVNNTQFKFKNVLLSKQFNDRLRKYCKEELKDETHFWCFSGTTDGEHKLDLSKLSNDDLNLLDGDNDPHNYVMFQMKKKNREIMIGANNIKT